MPTAVCVPQANGYYLNIGSASVVGATLATAWAAVNDNPHDSNTTYINISTSDDRPNPRVSFLFHGASNLTPAPLTLYAVHRRTGVNAPTVTLGLSRQVLVGGVMLPEVVLGTAQNSPVAYGETMQALTVHPYTGLPWRAGDANGWEILVQIAKHPLDVHPITVRLTALRVEFTYDEPTFYRGH